MMMKMMILAQDIDGISQNPYGFRKKGIEKYTTIDKSVSVQALLSDSPNRGLNHTPMVIIPSRHGNVIIISNDV